MASTGNGVHVNVADGGGACNAEFRCRISLDASQFSCTGYKVGNWSGAAAAILAAGKDGILPSGKYFTRTPVMSLAAALEARRNGRLEARRYVARGRG